MDNNLFDLVIPPQNDPFKIATVQTVSSGKATVQFWGEDEAKDKLYKCLGSYSPTVNDTVLMAKCSGTLLILGKF